MLSNHTWERIAAGLSDLRAAPLRCCYRSPGSGALGNSRALVWRTHRLWRNAASRKSCQHVVLAVQSQRTRARGRAVRAIWPSSRSDVPRTSPMQSFPATRRRREDGKAPSRSRHCENVVILNPGAGWGAKQWPAERYGEVAKRSLDGGFSPIINFGPREESLAKVAEAASGGTACALSFSVGELIALMRRARLFIGGDTGPMHLAAALHVPVVALFGPTDPARNGPYRTTSIVLRHTQ